MFRRTSHLMAGGALLLAAFDVGFELLVNWCTRRFMPWYRRDEKAD